jgi:hypothetical protein
MAAWQQHTAWRIAYYILLTTACGIAAIDYLYQQRMVLTLLCFFGTLGWAFQLVRHIIGVLRKKEASKQNPLLGCKS